MIIILLLIIGLGLFAFGLWGVNDEKNVSTLKSYTKMDSWSLIIFGVIMILAAINLFLK
jgi:threonine/homoserine/homoserine lactone efflux protein|tara:strand:+ start:13725 stop:13901 length:177 start_codon:yes stop_codon:yes gene_type:complete